jgi:hypothetical protein
METRGKRPAEDEFRLHRSVEAIATVSEENETGDSQRQLTEGTIKWILSL